MGDPGFGPLAWSLLVSKATNSLPADVFHVFLRTNPVGLGLRDVQVKLRWPCCPSNLFFYLHSI